MAKQICKQVWECNGAHKYRYVSPIGIIDFICPNGHQGVLIEGDPVVLKPKKKRDRMKTSNSNKVLDKRSELEKVLDKLKREDGKIVAQKALF